MAAPSIIEAAISNGSVTSHRQTPVYAARIVRPMPMATAAAALLRERGEPMTGKELMEALPAKGVNLDGANVRINFTSAMSKSGKFDSLRLRGGYYWWFKGEPLPPEWNEAPDLLEGRSDASAFNSSQEGGEDNAATTTAH